MFGDNKKSDWYDEMKQMLEELSMADIFDIFRALFEYEDIEIKKK